jgi:hypothetical protein
MPRSRMPPAGEPIVSTVGRAGELLGVDPARLAVAVRDAQLPAWGRHASGEPVYAWAGCVVWRRSWASPCRTGTGSTGAPTRRRPTGAGRTAGASSRGWVRQARFDVPSRMGAGRWPAGRGPLHLAQPGPAPTPTREVAACGASAG